MADETDPNAPTGAMPPQAAIDAMANTADTGPGHAPTGAMPPQGAIDALANTADTGPGLADTGDLGGEGDARGHHRVPSDALFRWGHLYALKQLGAGGFGQVYRAYDPVLDRDVALKLHREDDRSAAYLAEARSLARLKHPNVLAVHGADVHDGRAGIWTDLVDGRDFEFIVKNDGPLSAAETIRVGVELCRALAAVHGTGMVHGDIKTHNVMRARGGQIVLMDFGAVSPVGGDSGASAGTLVAMAPELLAGEAPSVRSDIFALGVLLYRLSCGRWPYADLSVAAVSRGDQTPTPLRDQRADLPSAFVEVVERAMAVEPGRRPGSAGVMERALMALTAEAAARAPVPETPAPEPVPLPPAASASPRSRWPLAVAVVAVLVAAYALLRPAPEVEAPSTAVSPDASTPATPSIVPEAPAAPPPRATATVDLDETDEIDRDVLQVWRTPGGAHLFVPPHVGGRPRTPSYVGDAQRAYRQPSAGSSRMSATHWSFTFWDPRIPEGRHALFLYRDGAATVDCGENDLTLTRIDGDPAAAMVKGLALKRPRWNRRAWLLARAANGDYVYVDLLAGYERTGFRLFRGPRGALREYPLDVATVDENGSLFASAEADVRQGRLPYFVGSEHHAGAPDDIEWIARDGSREKLVAVSTFTHAALIYGALGVYASDRLGSPCDEVLSPDAGG